MRPRVAALAVALVVVLAAGAVTPAGATPLDDAKAKVIGAQQAADAATLRYETVIGRLEEIDAQVGILEEQIRTGKEQAAALLVVARRRAVEAYTGRDSMNGLAGILDGGDPLDDVRRRKLLARTKQQEDSAIAQLDVITSDLRSHQRDLEERRVEQAKLVTQVEAEQAQVQTQLQEAQQALTALEEQLRKEEEERKAREIAAAIARSASNRSNGRDYSGTFVVTGLVCPIRGALSFIDSWGFPRHQGAHKGVDLMSPRGTPNVAVVSGNVTFRAGGTSGNGAYLRGDDGHLYYYFHLEAYEGGPRHVAQGEVIGYVGNTGDARYTATHTHFEIHPGGGGAINPYPSVRAVC